MIEINKHREDDYELFLKYLVGINSQAGNQLGIEKTQKVFENELVELGFRVESIRNDKGLNNHLFVAKKIINDSYPTVCLIGHSDVVTSPDHIPYQREERLICGAGVADNKGGLVVGLRAIRNYLKEKDQRVNIIFVISPSEETGSIGHHSSFKDIARNCDFVLGLEPALQCGSVISSRSGNRWYHIHSQGIAAHSGRFGHSHINAAHQLSLLISKLHNENNELIKRRVNVGSISSRNNNFNTICSQADAKLDIRFSSFSDRDYLHGVIKNEIESAILVCPVTSMRGRFFYSLEDDCPPMERTGSTLLNKYLKEIGALENSEITHKHSGGAADINYFSGHGAILIDGLGPIAGGLHTKNE